MIVAVQRVVSAWLGLLITATAPTNASVPVPDAVAKILDAEPGATASPQTVVRQVGHSITGGSVGTFESIAQLNGFGSRVRVTSGPVSDEDGWDGGAWAAHDGIVTAIDLPGAVADARAEAFLRSYGWRDRKARAAMRALGDRTVEGRVQHGIEVWPAGADRISLWFDALDHRLANAVVDADMGAVQIRFGD